MEETHSPSGQEVGDKEKSTSYNSFGGNTPARPYLLVLMPPPSGAKLGAKLLINTRFFIPDPNSGAGSLFILSNSQLTSHPLSLKHKRPALWIPNFILPGITDAHGELMNCYPDFYNQLVPDSLKSS